MNNNLGGWDRIVRLLVASVIVALYLNKSLTGPWAIILLVVAVIFVITSLINFCPLYTVFGWSTKKPTKI